MEWPEGIKLKNEKKIEIELMLNYILNYIQKSKLVVCSPEENVLEFYTTHGIYKKRRRHKADSEVDDEIISKTCYNSIK